MKHSCPEDCELSGDFSADEISEAMKDMKSIKTSVFDCVHNEFLINSDIFSQKRLPKFLTDMRTGRLPVGLKEAKTDVLETKTSGGQSQGLLNTGGYKNEMGQEKGKEKKIQKYPNLQTF